jgi:hypothetical protein
MCHGASSNKLVQRQSGSQFRRKTSVTRSGVGTPSTSSATIAIGIQSATKHRLRQGVTYFICRRPGSLPAQTAPGWSDDLRHRGGCGRMAGDGPPISSRATGGHRSPAARRWAPTPTGAWLWASGATVSPSPPPPRSCTTCSGRVGSSRSLAISRSVKFPSRRCAPGSPRLGRITRRAPASRGLPPAAHHFQCGGGRREDPREPLPHQGRRQRECPGAAGGHAGEGARHRRRHRRAMPSTPPRGCGPAWRPGVGRDHRRRSGRRRGRNPPSLNLTKATRGQRPSPSPTSIATVGVSRSSTVVSEGGLLP